MPKTGYRKPTSENFVEKSNLSDTGRADRDMLWPSVFTNCTPTLKRSASELCSLKSEIRKSDPPMVDRVGVHSTHIG